MDRKKHLSYELIKSFVNGEVLAVDGGFLASGVNQ